MNNLKPNPDPVNNIHMVDLHKLVGQLATGLLPYAVQKKSFILNDIQPDVFVCTDENLLSFVLSNLLNNAVVNTDNDCIHVTAMPDGESMLIHVKDHNGNAARPLNFGWDAINPVVEKLGGYVSFDQHESNGTTIAFSFAGKQKVA